MSRQTPFRVGVCYRDLAAHSGPGFQATPSPRVLSRPTTGDQRNHVGLEDERADAALARRMQDIESGTGYDTRRRALAGTFVYLSQTTGYTTVRLPTCFG